MRKVSASLFGACCAASSLFAGFATTEPSYVNQTTGGDFQFQALATVGDYVPLTSGAPTDKFGFVGIPDAMGLYKDPVTSENILFVGHELPSGTLSEPFYGSVKYKGAWVSRFVLGSDASITSGGVAHGALYVGNTFFSGTPPLETDTQNFTRFCSGSFAGPAHGMDRPIFFTNEENNGGNFDNAGGPQTVAIYDGEMHTVPALGRIVRENTVVMPRRDALTAVISTEDGGTLTSYVYMYVGTKDRRGTDALSKNGLTGGKIYVLAGRGANAGASETSFTSGTILARWVEIPNAATLTATQLTAAAGTAGGYKMVRVEDAEFDPVAPTRVMFFGTTGGTAPNALGRLYKINFNPTTPSADCTLDLIYNADAVVTPGGNINAGVDFPVSIDNIAVTAKYIVICEDRNAPADAVFAKYGRNGGVWTLDRTNGYAAKYQGDFNFAYANARDGVASRSAGLWETSGVIDASSIFGADSFLINVQAHSNATNARSNIQKPDGSGVFTKAEATTRFVEDGQLLLMKLKTANN